MHLADDSSVFSKIPLAWHGGTASSGRVRPHPPLLRGGTQPHRPFHALGSDAVEDGQDLARGEEVCGGSDGDAGREWVTKLKAEHYVVSQSLPILCGEMPARLKELAENVNIPFFSFYCYYYTDMEALFEKILRNPMKSASW